MCFSFDSNLYYLAQHIPCLNLPNTQYMEDFGLCQTGIAAAQGKDDSLLMGAPGSVFWRGTVFAVNITDKPGASSTEKTSPFIQEKDVKDGEQAAPTKVYSYNGYAVAIGQFGPSKKLYYVSGAPKSGKKGNVIFYTATNEERLRYEKPHILEGKMEFSGYGSSLLAVDINMDGFDDLIVGAPYYYRRNYGGAFYVYLGGPNMITEDTEPTEILSRDMGEEECKKLQCEHARFGMSIAKLGDINKDGFNDFAVGAPYEGKGAVYIYHGSDAKEGFKTKYVQRITSDDLPESDLHSFGYSLSGGMDLDANSYPDLLVGAYESDAVALIRSRPIVKLQPRISVSPKSVDLDSTKGCSLEGVPDAEKDRQCIAITLCLNFTSSINVIPEVMYKLEAEPRRKVARVELVGAQDADQRFVENKKMVLNSTKEVCATEIGLVKSKIEDKFNPIDFRFSFDLSSDSEDPAPYPQSALQDINAFPFLDTDGADPSVINSKSAPVDFIMECGDDNKCYSNLQFTAEIVNLTRNAGMYELFIGTKNVLNINMSVWNDEEPAYLTKVYIQAPENVGYLGTDPKDGVSCQRLKEVEGTLLVCDGIGNPLRMDEMVEFSVRLDVPRYFAETPDITHNITVWVNTSSTEQTPLNDKYVLDFRVINKAELILGTNVVPDSAILCKGEPRGASAMRDETAIGAAVTHNFIINNDGPGVVSESYITIQWPYEVAGSDGGAGKYLLYPMRMPKIVGNVIKCNDDDIRRFVNPLGIK
ncbi:integrin alpha-6, partial [Plakobranchus ocellatus]